MLQCITQTRKVTRFITNFLKDLIMATVKVEKTAIVCDNGSTQEFTAKGRLNMTIEVAGDGSATATAYFRNGKVAVVKTPASLAADLIEHGLNAKLRDTIAGADKIEDAFGAFETAGEFLSKGEWSKERISTGGSTASSKELAQAVANAKGADLAKVIAWLEGKTPGEKLKLRSQPTIQLEIAKLRAARASTKEDAADTFEGL